MSEPKIHLPQSEAQSPEFADANLWRVWCWCLFAMAKAQRKERVAVGKGFAEIPVSPGQFIYQRGAVAKALGLPDSTVRNLMVLLMDRGRVVAMASEDKQFTMVTIVDAECYLRALAPRRTSTPSKLAWSPATGWTGIEDTDRERWTEAYPSVDQHQELAAADLWLRNNPAKAIKRRWGQFIANWFGRTQGRGGSRGGKPGPLTPAAHLEDVRSEYEPTRRPQVD